MALRQVSSFSRRREGIASPVVISSPQGPPYNATHDVCMQCSQSRQTMCWVCLVCALRSPPTYHISDVHNVCASRKFGATKDKPAFCVHSIAATMKCAVQRPDMITILEAGELWMTDVTLQGDGQRGRSDATRAIHIKDFFSKLYAESTLRSARGLRSLYSVCGIAKPSASSHTLLLAGPCCCSGLHSMHAHLPHTYTFTPT